MDVSQTQPSRKASDSMVRQTNSGYDDRKEVAWAFVGLLLWSAVVVGGLVGVGYLLGHSIFHLW